MPARIGRAPRGYRHDGALSRSPKAGRSPTFDKRERLGDRLSDGAADARNSGRRGKGSLRVSGANRLNGLGRYGEDDQEGVTSL